MGNKPWGFQTRQMVDTENQFEQRNEAETFTGRPGACTLGGEAEAESEPLQIVNCDREKWIAPPEIIARYKISRPAASDVYVELQQEGHMKGFRMMIAS